MPEIPKPAVPASQKGPLSDTASKSASTSNEPKRDETGAVKNPAGETVKASESVKKEGVVTGDKAPPKKEEEPKPLEASNVKIEGEVLQGDSFRLSLTRGNVTVQIPVPVEGVSNVVILDNTFRLVKEFLEAKTEKDLRGKFNTLIK